MSFFQNSDNTNVQKCTLNSIGGNLNDSSVKNYFINLQVTDHSGSHLVEKLLPWLISTTPFQPGESPSRGFISGDEPIDFLNESDIIDRDEKVLVNEPRDGEALDRTCATEVFVRGDVLKSCASDGIRGFDSSSPICQLNAGASVFVPHIKSSSSCFKPSPHKVSEPRNQCLSPSLNPHALPFVPRAREPFSPLNPKATTFVSRARRDLKYGMKSRPLSPLSPVSTEFSLPDLYTKPPYSPVEQEQVCHPWACYCPVCSRH